MVANLVINANIPVFLSLLLVLFSDVCGVVSTVGAIAGTVETVLYGNVDGCNGATGTSGGVTCGGVTWRGVTWGGVTWGGVTWGGVTCGGVTCGGVTCCAFAGVAETVLYKG